MASLSPAQTTLGELRPNVVFAMPTLTICPTPGCGTLTPGGHCPTHRKADDQRRLARRNRDGRNTKQWQRIRQAVLHRDDYTCDCGARATHVHRSSGGYHDTNLADYVSMCPSCHGRHHQAEQHGRGRSAS